MVFNFRNAQRINQLNKTSGGLDIPLVGYKGMVYAAMLIEDEFAAGVRSTGNFDYFTTPVVFNDGKFAHGIDIRGNAQSGGNSNYESSWEGYAVSITDYVPASDRYAVIVNFPFVANYDINDAMTAERFFPSDYLHVINEIERHLKPYGSFRDNPLIDITASEVSIASDIPGRNIVFDLSISIPADSYGTNMFGDVTATLIREEFLDPETGIPEPQPDGNLVVNGDLKVATVSAPWVLGANSTFNADTGASDGNITIVNGGVTSQEIFGFESGETYTIDVETTIVSTTGLNNIVVILSDDPLGTVNPTFLVDLSDSPTGDYNFVYDLMLMGDISPKYIVLYYFDLFDILGSGIFKKITLTKV